MGEVVEELNTLKIRANKGHGGVKLTIKDITRKTSQSCLLTEAIPILAGRVNKGEGAMIIHIVDHAAEKARKLTNPTQTTKKIFNCRTPDQWKQFNAALEPFYEEAVDPGIAVDLIIMALESVSRETIKDWIAGGEEQRPGPPKAELPESVFAARMAEEREPGADEVEDLPDFLRD